MGQDAGFVGLDLAEPVATGRHPAAAAIFVPDGGEGERPGLFEQGEAGGEIAGHLGGAEFRDGLEQGEEERLDRVAGADGPGGDAIDAGIEKIEADGGAG